MVAQIDAVIEARVKRLSRYYALLSAVDREIIHPGTRDGYRILTVENPTAAFGQLATHEVQVIVFGQRMPVLRTRIHEAFRVARGLARL